MDADKVEAVLKGHIRMCTDLYELFLEEGKEMRATGVPPTEEFLEKKKGFLGALDRGIELLQRINENPESFPRSLAPLVKEARDLVMKIMMIDRENERLLLKASLPPRMKQAYSKVIPGQVAKAYSRFSK